VEIRCAYLADEQRLFIAVRDSGCGMDEAQQAALFQRYSQVGPASRIEGGTGLGLAISHDLVEALGGQITVASAPGEGAEFAFTIAAPACEIEDGALGDTEGGVDLSDVRILVVDDNPVNRDIAKAILGPLGVVVTEAADGLDAVAKGSEATFDLILMDLRMPGMNGPEAAGRLRAEPGPNRATPILAFSADIDAELVAGSDDTFDGYVRKPLQIQDLIEAVGAVVVARIPVAPLPGGVSRRIGEGI
jgi:CheY-like chemotaxis protein